MLILFYRCVNIEEVSQVFNNISKRDRSERVFSIIAIENVEKKYVIRVAEKSNNPSDEV
jgi:hypothetical protein